MHTLWCLGKFKGACTSTGEYLLTFENPKASLSQHSKVLHFIVTICLNIITIVRQHAS